jgi:dihydroxyacetone kinase-like protein
MKKLIDHPQNVPAEFLAGLALAHADILKVCLDPVYVVRVDALQGTLATLRATVDRVSS